jgi:hypothetical protein
MKILVSAHYIDETFKMMAVTPQTQPGVFINMNGGKILPGGQSREQNT